MHYILSPQVDDGVIRIESIFATPELARNFATEVSLRVGQGVNRELGAEAGRELDILSVIAMLHQLTPGSSRCCQSFGF